jgi:DNA polymerase
LRRIPDRTLLGLGEYLKYLDELGADFITADRTSAGPGPFPSESYERVRERILVCALCRLSQSRTHAVPGEGSLDARLMFVGEGPGRDEDIQGKPFVGRAGQLLTKIIQAMKFTRDDVYITNIVKCRPPENRTPHRDEIDACTPYLRQQLALVKPVVIVTLGKVATDFFVPSSLGMTSLRGQFYPGGDFQVMPTFHPSYLIRNEGNKELRKMVWEDMQKVMAVLGKT